MKNIILLFVVAFFVACGGDKDSTDTSGKGGGAEAKQAKALQETKIETQEESFVNVVDEVKRRLPTPSSKSEADTSTQVQQGEAQ